MVSSMFPPIGLYLMALLMRLSTASRSRSGAALLRPLRRQPLVGGGELVGALAHALLQPNVRLVQLVVENDVVEGDRKPAAEHLDQGAVGDGHRSRGLQHDDDLALAGCVDVE